MPATIIEDLKHVLGNHTGESEVVLDVTTSGGARTLRFGEEFRVSPTAVAARRARAHPRPGDAPDLARLSRSQAPKQLTPRVSCVSATFARATC